jgi:2-C-methyl-D-erythritol 4-phosphate cytidylyltransferase
MGGEMPKQFAPIAGKPLLMHTIETFYRQDELTEIIVVLPAEHEEYWKMLCRETGCVASHTIVHGGETRFHSVKNGLAAVPSDVGLIAVHDGVRPFVAPDVIAACFDEAARNGAAIPVISMIESVREVDGATSRPADRNKLRLVQTPQIFRAEILRKAYQQPYNEHFTDDASVVEADGGIITLVAGNRENIKITTPPDMIIAKYLLGNG